MALVPRPFPAALPHGEIREVLPGKGSLDYTTYLRRLSRLPQNPPLMLEHLAKAEEYAAARDYIKDVGRKAGLSFDPA